MIFLYCENCGKEIINGNRFCTQCGTAVKEKDVSFEKPAAFPENGEIKPLSSPVVPLDFPSDTNGFRPEMNAEKKGPEKRKKPVGIIIAVSVLAVLLAAGGIFACLLMNGTISLRPQQCKNCQKELSEGYYCDECLDLLTYDYSRLICQSCSAEHNDSPKELKKNEIFYINKYGAIYCKDCETDRLCVECKGFIPEKINGNRCPMCCDNEGSDYTICGGCFKVIKYQETAGYIPGKHWQSRCKDCDTGRRCSDCRETMLAENDDDSVCYSCSETYCVLCMEALERSEVSYSNDRGGWSQDYCKDCDTGKYCGSCGEVLEKNDDDSVCTGCADKNCFSCYDVLTAKEISFTFQAEYGTRYYCHDCNTNKFCESCGDMLSVLDLDRVCSECAKHKCNYCNEVLEKDEISYSYKENYSGKKNTVILCKRCDTGKYCESCSIVLQEDDDDTVCSSCAQYTCSTCNEVLKKSEISHKSKDGEKIYCKECDSGKYCKECSEIVYGNNVDLCYDCGRACSVCQITITSSRNIHIDQWDNVICEACVRFCSDCGAMFDRYETQRGESKCDNCRNGITEER